MFEPTGHGLNLFEGHVQYNYVSKWLDEGIRLQSKKKVPLNEWHHVALTYDGSRYAEGVKLYVDGEPWEWEVQLDDLNNPRPLARQPVKIGAGGGPQNRFKGPIDEVRIYSRDLTAAEVAVLADPPAGAGDRGEGLRPRARGAGRRSCATTSSSMPRPRR